MSEKNELDQLFEVARQNTPEPSSDFLARVLSDAEAMQPAPVGLVTAIPAKRGFFAEMFAGLSDAIGGWPAFAGLATAAVTGVWIGISPPQSLSAPLASVLGVDEAIFSETFDSGDGFDFTLFEG